jgi:hypothetical protein
MQKGRKV